MAFVQSVRAAGDGALFRELRVKGGSRVQAFTDGANRWLRDVADAQSYYSHRHSVTSIMANATTPAMNGQHVAAIGESIQHYIMGHGAKNAHGKYGRRDQVQTLVAAIEIVAATLDHAA